MNRIDTHVASQVADVVRAPQQQHDRQLQNQQAVIDRIKVLTLLLLVKLPLKVLRRASLSSKKSSTAPVIGAWIFASLMRAMPFWWTSSM